MLLAAFGCLEISWSKADKYYSSIVFVNLLNSSKLV